MAHRYYQPRFLRLRLSLGIAIEGSCSSMQEPKPGSRCLYAGHRLASKQVSAKLFLNQLLYSVLMSSLLSTRLRQFTCVRFPWFTPAIFTITFP